MSLGFEYRPTRSRGACKCCGKHARSEDKKICFRVKEAYVHICVDCVLNFMLTIAEEEINDAKAEMSFDSLVATVGQHNQKMIVWELERIVLNQMETI